MSQSQIEANKKDISSGKRVTQKQRILNLLKGNFPMSRREIEKATNFQAETVTGRLSELAADGFVTEQDLNGVSYYTYVFSNDLKEVLRKQKTQAKTKRVLNALIKDDEALNVIMEKVLSGSCALFMKGYESDFIKEDIIAVIKNEIKN